MEGNIERAFLQVGLQEKGHDATILFWLRPSAQYL